MAQGGNDFNAIKISLASPEQIKLWSYGEIMKPETINYRTLRPEKDGLFCERIFGPTKDWECYCGKYKKIRHRGIICDRCGVEIARAKVRRERMGHINLAAPVAHIWFSKGTPSRLGLMLNLSPKNLDRVLYFAQYIITGIDEEERADALDMRHSALDLGARSMESAVRAAAAAIHESLDARVASVENDVRGLLDKMTDALNALPPEEDSDRATEALFSAEEALEQIAALYKDEIAPLRSALFAKPGDGAELPERFKDWGEARRRFAKASDDFVGDISGLASLLYIAADAVGGEFASGAKANVDGVQKAAGEIARITDASAPLLNPYARYHDEILPLRALLYAKPGDDAQPPEDYRDWKEVGRRHDKMNDDFLSDIKTAPSSLLDAAEAVGEEFAEASKANMEALERQIDEIERIYEEIEDIEGLKVGALLTESQFRDLRVFCEEVFSAGMGAESVLRLLEVGDMAANHGAQRCAEIRAEGLHCHCRRDVCAKECYERGEFCISINCMHLEIRATSGMKHKRAVKRLRVVDAFRKSENKPEWMIFTNLPVLPPELRPMVQLDGGRFATSDLNDLYRRVINRNNRLKRLIDLQAPEIIVRNEKRMLQEAVDALVDNGRRGRAVAGSHNHKLKSLSDLLRGKQGRFRQNLLGKRVDYSGRSVIIVGPELKLHQCGLPRKMALELFKPFVMNKLVMNGYAHNIKSAKRLAESERPQVWDILERVVQDRPVLLNRAPTLHRLGIQAFQPVLIEGSAIRLHPLVTTAFNADFDGDQMAVHVPLSKEAVWEAKRMMMSTYNMLAPSSGEPIVAPTLDMVLGCFYMTQALEGARGEGREFADIDDARLAYELGLIDLRALVRVRKDPSGGADWAETTPGRIIFNDSLPEEIGFYNAVIDKGALKDITSRAHQLLGSDDASVILDSIKDLGFSYASKSGVTIAINDVEVPDEKREIVSGAKGKIDALDQMYMDGLLTEDDRYRQAVDIWTSANDDLTAAVEDNLAKYGGVGSGDDGDEDGESAAPRAMSNAGIGLYMMATSGAKGNIAQIKQMAGMRGLMSDPKGRIIERPVEASFREGLSVLEYFLSTHGARKGLTDTALRTADSGYLTRRLIDVAQELIIFHEDCGTADGLWLSAADPESDMPTFADRAKSRYAAAPIANPETGEIIAERGDLLTENSIAAMLSAGIDGALVRSPLHCEAERGLCRMCYGLSLATWKPIMVGEAVGIIAAQSIGEPGTQLTMRTFHTGGIAGSDITSGLPRVQELFEARVPKGEAVLSEIDGAVEVMKTTDNISVVQVVNTETLSDEYELPEGSDLRVADGEIVSVGDTLAEALPDGADDANGGDAALAPAGDIVARVDGQVIVKEDGALSIMWQDNEEREHQIPHAAHIIVNSGDVIAAGDPITAGPKNPQRILSLQGSAAVQQYLINEVQKVYRSQGVTIHDKHIEVIVSQMLRKVEVEDAGDTNLLPGDQIDRRQFEEINAAVLAEGGEPATAIPVLLGITRASLKMDSFLSAASFQETTRVLTEAAVNSEVDYLRGLKENVIIGRLIPARLDLTDEGRAFLDIPEDDDSDDPIAMMRAPMPIDDYGAEMAKAPFGMEPQYDDGLVDGAVEEQAPVLGDD